MDDLDPIFGQQAFRIRLKNIELMTKRKVFQDQCAMGLQGGIQRTENDAYHEGQGMMRSP